jgi:hypothetical protein
MFGALVAPAIVQNPSTPPGITTRIVLIVLSARKRAIHPLCHLKETVLKQVRGVDPAMKRRVCAQIDHLP